MIFDANIRLGRLAGSRGPCFAKASDLLRTMDRFGIDSALVYHALARESDYAAGNRLLHERIDGRPRLVPCWVAIPNRDDPQRFVGAMHAHGAPAARLFPRSGHFSIRPWCLGPLAEALTQHRKTLLIDFESQHWSNDEADWDGIDQLCAAWPALPVVIVGVTVAGPANFTPLMKRHANLYLEIGHLGCPGQIVRLLNDGHGNRLLYGSDLPTRHPGAPLNMIVLEQIPETQRRAILHDNLAHLLHVTLPASTATQPPPAPVEHVIDTHVHLGGWNNSAAGSGIAGDTIRDMDRCGINTAVVTSLWSCYGEVAEGNRAVAQACAEHPGRFYGYLTLDPKHPDEVAKQIAIHFQNPAFVGIKLHGQTHAIDIADPLCQPILEYANDHALPVLIHGNLTPEPWRRVCPQYPRAKLIVAHVGGSGPDMASALELARLCRTLDNLFFDLASSRSYYMFLEKLIALAGVEKILYGSDHPLFDFSYELGQVCYSDISDEDRQSILAGNAARIFNFATNNLVTAKRREDGRSQTSVGTYQRLR